MYNDMDDIDLELEDAIIEDTVRVQCPACGMHNQHVLGTANDELCCWYCDAALRLTFDERVAEIIQVCPICGGFELVELNQNAHSTVYRCPHCGLVTIDHE
ncbi:MAG TPA: hypothetical protein PKD09_09435 [Aggregatilinea sp.]|uniref:hypothetical protein n=1 Tax=Aggregatilinea sp. TaxID=2806333 RepID=UPI002B8EBE8E|nr:hypothetical protein [Aggregatilinea sp.]HML21859.1 hypothetical protein [Aggregatilinea sp.]